MVALRFLAVTAVTLLASVPALLAVPFGWEIGDSLLNRYPPKCQTFTITSEVTTTSTVTSTSEVTTTLTITSTSVSTSTMTVTPISDTEIPTETTTETDTEPTTSTTSAQFPVPTETKAQFIIFFNLSYSATSDLGEVRDSFYATLNEKAVPHEYVYSMGSFFNADVVNLERGSEYYISKLPQVQNPGALDNLSILPHTDPTSYNVTLKGKPENTEAKFS
ncbi:hypothetical protein IWQ61_000106 [Dispira simplex]|nr:hypothetical protein IWQ61_000106 [Dispira simplex]